MKIIVAGGRDFTDREKLYKVLNSFKKEITVLITGMARGADTLGKEWAVENKINILKFPALWDTYGKSAGYKRNVEMANNADGVILFKGGKGTQHMLDISIKKNLKILYNENESLM